MENNSLTETESYLLSRNYKTKMGKDFTRFSIKSILTNPVYMISDNDAFEYLTKNNAQLFSDEDEFDGIHGIMAYNRTVQEQGRASKLNPMNEWIVSVGKHQGLIAGSDWVKVQKMLNANKSKSYGKAKSHTALLSGLLRCGDCGEFMRPHMSKRINKDGEYTYYYSCNMKLRSKKARCNMKNCNGNEIDKQIINAIKVLGDNKEYYEALKKELKASKLNEDNLSKEIVSLNAEIERFEKEIEGLMNSLSSATGTGAEKYLLNKINSLSEKVELNKVKIETLENENDTAFSIFESIELMKDMIKSISSTIDNMSIEQKRSVIRTFIKQVVWDGSTEHIIFFGSDYDYPFKNADFVNCDTSSDLEYPLCEDRKRTFDVFSWDEETG